VSRLFEFDMCALETALDDERRARKLTWDQLSSSIEAFEKTAIYLLRLGRQSVSGPYADPEQGAQSLAAKTFP
jgi:hypothetical protein